MKTFKLLRELQLLLELRERIDRYYSYGSWLDSRTGETHPVPRFGHAFVARRLMKKAGVSETDPYSFAFTHGLVRLVHEDPSEIDIEGTGEALQAAAQYLTPSFSQEDLQMVIIAIVVNPYQGSGDDFDTISKIFVLSGPKERREATSYLRGIR